MPIYRDTTGTTMIKFRMLRGLFLIAACFTSFTAFSQYTDLKLRIGAEVEKEMVDNLNAGIEFEQRFMRNISTFDKTFIEPSLSYKFSKHIRAGIIWRIMLLEDNNTEVLSKQRYSAYARYDVTYYDFRIKFRTALQYGFDDISNAAFSVDQKLINRNAVEVEYDWFGQKITPGVKFELFHHLNHPNGSILNQWRLKLGANYELTKNSAIDVYYMFENEFNVVEPVDAHILGVKYSYEF